jgi:acetyltransferase-like isoleucine patch superfamily enzyme
MILRIAGVPEPYNLPWHLAMEQGAFTEAGMDLHWHTVHEGTGRMCQMLKDDELDLAVLVTEGAVRDILNGGPHRIVGTFVDSALPWGVHVPAASNLHAPGELKGLPYAISRLGSGSHIMAMIHAERLGWRPAETDTAHPTAVIDEGCTIGEGTRIWHFSHIMPGCVIGGELQHRPERGDQPGRDLGPQREGAEQREHLHRGGMRGRCVPGAEHGVHQRDQPAQCGGRRGQYLRTMVGRGASIGANATIVCGHDIGRFAFIGAGAVVTQGCAGLCPGGGQPRPADRLDERARPQTEVQRRR